MSTPNSLDSVWNSWDNSFSFNRAFVIAYWQHPPSASLLKWELDSLVIISAFSLSPYVSQGGTQTLIQCHSINKNKQPTLYEVSARVQAITVYTSCATE